MREGIYVDTAPETDSTLLTGFIVHYRESIPFGFGDHKGTTTAFGPYRVAPFTACTLPFIRAHAEGLHVASDAPVYVCGAADCASDPCPCGNAPIGHDTLARPVCDDCAPLFQGPDWSQSAQAIPPQWRPGADFIDGAFLLSGAWDDGVVACETDAWDVYIGRTTVDDENGRRFADGWCGTAREVERFILSGLPAAFASAETY